MKKRMSNTPIRIGQNYSRFNLMASQVTGQLWEAVQKKKVCNVRLRTELVPRTIHPYGVCQTSRKKMIVVCWQIAGLTQAKNLPGYRSLTLEEISTVEVTDETFSTQTNFNPADPLYKTWAFHV